MQGTAARLLLNLEFLAGGFAQGDAGPGDAGREHSSALRCALQPAQLSQAAPEGQSHCHHGYGAGMGGFGAPEWVRSSEGTTQIWLVLSLVQ